MVNKTVIGIEALSHNLAPPKRAYLYIERFFNKKKINQSKAARSLKVSPSTIKRLLDGGSLTTSMASKLYDVYQIDPETLFNLEAKANSFEAKNLTPH